MSIQRRWRVWVIAGVVLLVMTGGILMASRVLDAGPAVSVTEIKTIDATHGAVGGWIHVEYSADGKMLSASLGTQVAEYDATTGAPLRAFKPAPQNEFNYQVFLTGGQQIAAIERPGLHIYDARSGDEIRTLDFVPSVIFDYARFAVSPDGKIVAATYTRDPNVSMAQGISLMDASTGKELHRLEQHTGQITQVTFSADGQRLLTASNDGSVVIWDSATGQPVRTLKGHSQPVRDADFSTDSSRVLDCSNDGTVVEWNVKTGKPLLTLEAPNKIRATSVAYSRDESLIVAGLADGTLQIWGERTGRLLKTVPGVNSPIMNVAVSPDGQTLALAQWNGLITLLEIQIG